MRVDQDLVGILKICRYIDSKAREIYQEFSERFDSPEAKTFWHTMSLDEKDHVLYWEDLIELATKGMIPQVFDKPYEVRRDLEALKLKLNEIIAESKSIQDPTGAFLVAYKVEFAMLHPAFETLFHFIRSTKSDRSPEDNYANHLSNLVNNLGRLGKTTDEMELLGEMITRLWNRNRDLVVQTHTDPLAEVHNRRGFYHVMVPLAYLAQRNHDNVAMMMVDIDNFKSINDAHGHQVGDSIIALVAHIIKSQVRRSDVVGRYGGEEFIVFLVNAQTDYLDEISERIRSHVESDTKDRIPVTISLGLAYGNLDGDVEERLDTLVNIADNLMLEAKKQGKNRVLMSEG